LNEEQIPQEDSESQDPDNLDHLEFDSLSPLQQDAANMHEMFSALLSAGFTEYQGLLLTSFLTQELGSVISYEPGDEVEFTFDPTLEDSDADSDSLDEE
jgi:hypothetical protein